MGSNGSWYAVILNLSFSSFVLAFNGYDPNSLDAIICNYTLPWISKHKAGVLYRISLPSNFSDMEVSVVRLRSSTFWARGANFSFLDIPPRVMPLPHAKRLAMVYENLRNWSSSYYQLPGYIFLAPVVSFMAFDASNPTRITSPKLTLTIHGEPISIRFPQLRVLETNTTAKCVRFQPGGRAEFIKMVTPNLCTTTIAEGHFSIVVPNRTPPWSPSPNSTNAGLWEWSVIGFVAVIFAFVFIALIVMVIFKVFVLKKITEMEKESDKGMALSTRWIGMSKMPFASTTRTHAALDIDYAN
ncbi:hypothetical protein Nepgr_019130 [Nepenthes gracilis]|uniref:Uncharacterized protein n=1 Tax=Nepenthes gracilis TaxID=150966 RepID=A0AAD3SUV1_NEPGR|nr:hypothetical protein Nepgr_019130 [Nepenthes gracilis]